MDASAEWLSWAEAARLVGCAPRTLEYHAARGHIHRRPAYGSRPVLDAASIRGFAVQRDQARPRTLAKMKAEASHYHGAPEGWLTTEQAAVVLGLGIDRVRQLGHAGVLPRQWFGRGWTYPGHAVEALAEERRRWVSAANAAKTTGLTVAILRRAAHRGEILLRPATRAVPALYWESVLTWAANRPPSPVPASKPPPKTAAPDDGNIWLDGTTVALLLGISRTRVSQLTAEERIPHESRGGKSWYRRDHVEQLAAARAFHRVREHQAAPHAPVDSEPASARR